MLHCSITVWELNRMPVFAARRIPQAIPFLPGVFLAATLGFPSGIARGLAVALCHGRCPDAAAETQPQEISA